MKRRQILAAAGVGLAATALAGCNKEAETAAKPQQGGGGGETFNWKMVTSWPKNFPGVGVGAERFATLVNEMSNGRLKVKVYAAGELVPALEVFDAVSRGTAEMGHGAPYYWKGKVPAAQFFCALPFGPNAQEMNAWLHRGGGMQLWEEVYKPFGVLPMACGATGVQTAGWFNKEINGVDDFNGLKMRTPGLGGEVLTKMGGTVVNMPAGEIFTALQTGAIDATEWIGPYNDQALGLHKAAKYYYTPGWQEPNVTFELDINIKAWETLPADLQAIVRAAARDVNADMLDDYNARNMEAMEQLKAEGVEVRRLPDEVLTKLKGVAAEVVDAAAAADPAATKVWAQQRAYLDRLYEYAEMNEKDIYNIRG
ncbi:MAG: TRAP transporter substrate-binding protein [Gammaproteobacteria bacterium]|uniref:TRAP-type mannitol/chloroaromatic compound transport system, substrate-binding protein n=1 Tax=Pseudomonas cuatrocienegasensis TaxID=543360 RepID=A0ABY1B7A2_9PSED|nr:MULTISPECIES: TRAP transporter substrate-binding protein [Pseudomonas]MBU1330339.1 TRAP transporter substrate-binding protein [Gammaproteobacteria bacterium]MBU1489185.1 TRAP transporter substrate-binding protein [Gammaproteobacteria bacterium]MBU2065298.1 TRAP transporter substrate-binding protein [Gammaproteobacteria bacterium]MBU2139388.1 TRAP transporter substrate-binding protein [Gammaproteobacteria bacterium]MBU2218576.1 TRAP transporter substrate-binding protein [Gammaproteobacteria 